VCDHYVQPHAGGDAAFLLGVAKAVVEMGATDEAFLEAHTEGWPEFRAYVASLDWPQVEAASGVSQEDLRTVAKAYAASKSAVFCWAMGVTHHANGVENVQAIAALALLRGMVGRPHCGLLPLRGHSNVQGIGSMGVVPKLKDAVFERLQLHFGVPLPQHEGLDTLACMEAAERSEMRLAVCLGGNLYGSNPDASFAHRALGRVETVVYLSTTLNTGHVRGRGQETIVLPVLARDEESQATTQESMFNYVRLSDGGPKRVIGPRSEVEVVSAIASRVFPEGSPIDWRALSQHRRIREAIAHIVPGYEKIAAMDRTKEEFQIEGRTLHAPHFPTPSGKAVFHNTPLPPAHEGLRLLTVRSEGQFNTVVYEEEDLYRGQTRRDVVMMHPGDIARLGLSVGQRVSVSNDTGEMRGLTVRPLDVRQGNVVMYYPEANALVPRRADPRSRTPAFKSTPVTVSPD
jgi:molybdopterin-dependent oxidoreductase alpha subunit